MAGCKSPVAGGCWLTIWMSCCGTPSGLRDRIGLFAPCVSDLLEERFELFRSEVGAAEKWFAFGGEQHIERPAGAAGGGFDVRDVQAVDVGTFLAVDFDRNKILIQDGGNVGIGIRLLLHDVTPMTGEVADRKKDRFVLLAGLFKGFVAPGIPINWIVRMQEQIGTLGVNKPVGVAVLSCSSRGPAD